MKGREFWLGFLLLAASVTAQPERPSADYGVVRAIVSGSAVELEPYRLELRQVAELGFSRELLRVPESRSSRRFPQGAPLRWKVRNRTEVPDRCGVNWVTLHPSGFELHSLQVQDQARVMVLAEGNAIQQTEQTGWPLKAMPIDPDHLSLELAEPLPPGEYAVVYQPRDSESTVFCFGIDPVASP